MALDQQRAGRENVFCLAVEQSNCGYVAFQLRFAEREDRLRRSSDRKQALRHLVHADVGCLRRKDHRDQKLKRKPVMLTGSLQFDEGQVITISALNQCVD